MLVKLSLTMNRGQRVDFVEGTARAQTLLLRELQLLLVLGPWDLLYSDHRVRY